MPVQRGGVVWLLASAFALQPCGIRTDGRLRPSANRMITVPVLPIDQRQRGGRRSMGQRAEPDYMGLPRCARQHRNNASEG